jgi:hypothetical protein
MSGIPGTCHRHCADKRARDDHRNALREVGRQSQMSPTRLVPATLFRAQEQVACGAACMPRLEALASTSVCNRPATRRSVLRSCRSTTDTYPDASADYVRRGGP